jgi:hypothetical protein
MPKLPKRILHVLRHFECVLSERVWEWGKVLLIGAILAPGERTVEVATGTALWYHTGLPLVAVRWVLIRDPQGKFDPQALLCTDQEVTATQIIQWFVLRWQVEVTFHEVRSHLARHTFFHVACATRHGRNSSCIV